MINICFRKILRYDPTFNGKYSKFEGYKKITSQEMDPEIISSQDNDLVLPNQLSFPVFTSSMQRGKATAEKYFPGEKINVLDDLREIKFDLEDLLLKKNTKSMEVI